MSGNDRRDDEGTGRIAREAGRLLRRSAEDLDAATLSRLNRARQEALAELDRRRARPIWQSSGRPALVTAAACVLAIALWMGRDSALPPVAPGADPVPAAAGAVSEAADLELLLAGENLELLENLEFYDWLDADASAEDGLDPGLSG